MGLIGSALQGAASIFGGIAANNAMKQLRKSLERQQRDNQAWYDRNYNADSTQRADAQRILTLTEDAIRNRNKQAAGAQAVMGGTDAALAAAREANAQASADATAQIALAGERRKDAVENQFLQRKDAVNQQLNNLQMAKAQNIAQTASAVGKTLGGLDFGEIGSGDKKIPL